MQVTRQQIDQAALALFAAQVGTYDVLPAAAEMEWAADAQLRAFWRTQVQVVLDALAVEVRPV